MDQSDYPRYQPNGLGCTEIAPTAGLKKGINRCDNQPPRPHAIKISGNGDCASTPEYRKRRVTGAAAARQCDRQNYCREEYRATTEGHLGRDLYAKQSSEVAHCAA